MPDLFLDHWQRQSVIVDMMHGMTVAKRMDRELVEGPALTISPILAIQAGSEGVFSEYLANPVFAVGKVVCLAGMEKKPLRVLDTIVSLSHTVLILQIRLDLTGQSCRKNTPARLFGLGVLCGEIDHASGKVDVLELDPDEFSHPAAQFVNQLKHQPVLAAVDSRYKSPVLLQRHIPYDLAETGVFLERFHFWRKTLSVPLILPLRGLE
jgi:hypothetical protein